MQEHQLRHGVGGKVQLTAERVHEACEIGFNPLRGRDVRYARRGGTFSGLSAELFGGALAVIGEFIARKFLPNFLRGGFVPQLRLAQGLKISHLFGSRSAGRRAQLHLSQLLKENKSRGVPVFFVENFCLREEEDLSSCG